ncbi:SsrA-binding protein SmpB [uncultured Helicobacter sp.]|uniref:SsrA-binding protein SmpB n=1 Tax=Helicobacter sp. TaxID=218 RepID=UPI002609ECC1|nr:SsrA-binding protein SmpB [uncultured Helicobacter sp.]
MKLIAQNKKAHFDYEILEKLECGIVLLGAEVKSLRLSRCNLKDSFARFVKGELFVFGMHISFLQSTNPHFRPDEKRARKLLLHRKELDKWLGRVSQDGLSIVPLMIYFNKHNKVKLQIALVRGKQLHDKRESIKKRILDREARASLKDFGKRL